jgi:hypothetical protein
MSFTGIGRIGSQHILNVNIQYDTDNFGFPYGAALCWCTHPLKYSVDILDGDEPVMTAGSKIVTGTAALFTNLCSDFQLNSTPIYKYIAVQAKNSSNFFILEVDYVVDDNTIVLKFPAPETDLIQYGVPIDYFNTMILKEVVVKSIADPLTTVILEIGSKFGESSIVIVGASYYSVANEGGVEPLLFTAVGDAPVVLNY